MTKKKICWVTPDYFADCDMPLVPLVAKTFNIHWIILCGKHGNRYKEEDYEVINSACRNITIEYIYNSFPSLRGFNPLILLHNKRIWKAIQASKPDVIYYNSLRDSIFDVPFIRRLPKDMTIFTAHQGIVRKDMRFTKWTQFIRDLGYKGVKYVNMFSDSEANKLHPRYPSVDIIKIPLALKDFGEPTNQRPEKRVVRFLSFGLMVYAKHIDLLIDAANTLFERGYRNFRVVIAGKGGDWDRCKAHIKYPEIIETDIRRVENEEIPNLFNGSHFLVQPYRVVSQSGPMKIAFRYNLPDIVSNLPGLMCELKENINGFSFKSEDVNSLADVMENCVNMSDDDYNDLLQRMKNYTDKNYSFDVIVNKYCDMFDKVIMNRK